MHSARTCFFATQNLLLLMLATKTSFQDQHVLETAVRSLMCVLFFQPVSKIFQSYLNILKMENLIDASIQCDGDIGRSLDIRRGGLRRRITKLRKIVVNRKEVKLDRAKKGVLVRQLHPSNNLFSKFHLF